MLFLWTTKCYWICWMRDKTAYSLYQLQTYPLQKQAVSKHPISKIGCQPETKTKVCSCHTIHKKQKQKTLKKNAPRYLQVATTLKKIAAFWHSSYRTYKASSGCSYSQDQTVVLNFWSQAQALTKLFSTVELPWRFWCFSTNVTVDIAQFVTFANNCKCWSMYRIRLLAYSGLDGSRKWQVQINKCWQQVPMIDLVLLEKITKRYKDTKRVSVITTTLSHEKISPNASSGFMACRTRWRKHSCNLSFR